MHSLPDDSDISQLPDQLEKIDEEMIRKWVRELVLYKTAEKLIVPEAILKELGKRTGSDW